jgi:hypothetical protein
MALVGGGGSPNVAGGNPSGTGGSINYVGGNAYAGWSGQVTPTNSSPVTAFRFVTPSDRAYKTNIAFGMDTSTLASGELAGYEVKQNGQIILEKFVHPSSQGVATLDDSTIIMAAEAEIEIIAQTTDTDGVPMTVCLTMEGIE